MKLNIPLKPLSVNKAWQGRRFKSEDYLDYEEDLNRLLRDNLAPLEGKIEVRYKFYLKNHSRTDNDNLVKPIQDILVKLKYIKDDRYIYRTIIEKYPSKNDYMEIEILPYMV